MAKKKKTTKKRTHHHRGRIGGIGDKFNLMTTLELGVGLVLGNAGGLMVQKYLTALPQKAVALGELVLGIMNTDNSSPILKGAAYGFAGAGASGFAHDTGILRGIDQVMSGMLNSTVLGGGEDMRYKDVERLNGMHNDTTLGAEPGDEMQEPYAYSMPMGF